ncbi:MAG: hypothetical protein KI793_11180 [Rivularia sp. (in: Bacteria)]|nr:hypothetical protein [Rivularia sp. MS3]
MSIKRWHSVKNSYESVLQESLRFTHLSDMPWLIDQIIESKYASKFFPGLSHMSLFIQPTIELDTRKDCWIVIHPRANWFMLHYCYSDKQGIFTYDEYKVVLKDVKNLLFELMESLEKWKVENLPMWKQVSKVIISSLLNY